jgi:putative membrane protein
MYGMNGMSWGMGFGWFIGIVVLILVIWAITKGFNAKNNSTPTERKSALEILKERYARGDINKEEFEKIKQNLL